MDLEALKARAKALSEHRLTEIRMGAVHHAMAAGCGSKDSDKLLLKHGARAAAALEKAPDDPYAKAVFAALAQGMRIRMAFLDTVDAGTGASHAGDAYARRFAKALGKERERLARKAKGSAA